MGPTIYAARPCPISVFKYVPSPPTTLSEAQRLNSQESGYFYLHAGDLPCQSYRVPSSPWVGPRVWAWLRFGLCVPFGFPSSRRFRLPFWSWSPRVAAVSFILNVGSHLALVLVTYGGFVLFVPLFGASRWSTHARNWEVRVVKRPRLNSDRRIQTVGSGSAAGRS